MAGDEEGWLAESEDDWGGSVRKARPRPCVEVIIAAGILPANS